MKGEKPRKGAEGKELSKDRWREIDGGKEAEEQWKGKLLRGKTEGKINARAVEDKKKQIDKNKYYYYY